MKLKVFKVLLISLFMLFIIFFIQLYEYMQYQHKNILMIDLCSNNCKLLTNTNKYEKQPINEICTTENNIKIDCYNRIRELLLPQLLLYDVKINNKPIELIQFDRDTTYKVVLQAVENSQALIGYGIGKSCNFEDLYTKLFNKPAYAFDCGISKEQSKCKKCNFYEECIATDKFLIENQKSSENVHFFGEKLKQLNLEDKKIYLKMDIAGAEKDALPDILKYSKNINAISVVVHAESTKEVIQNIELLKLINKDFVLVSRSCILTKKNHKQGKNNLKYLRGIDLSPAMALTYVNKNITDKYRLKLIQSNKSNYTDLIQNKYDNINYEPYCNIKWQVLVAEFLRKHFNISYE